MAINMEKTIKVRIPRVCSDQWEGTLRDVRAGNLRNQTDMSAIPGEAESPHDQNVWLVSIRVDKLFEELERHLASGKRTVVSRLLERLMFWYSNHRPKFTWSSPHPKIDGLLADAEWGQHFHMDCQFVSLEDAT